MGNKDERYLCFEGPKGDCSLADFEESLNVVFFELRKVADNKTNIVSLTLYVSDIANQQRSIWKLVEEYAMELFGAYITIIEQPPTSGAKLALIAYAIKERCDIKLHNVSDCGIAMTHSSYETIRIRTEPDHTISIDEQAKQLFPLLEKELSEVNAAIEDNTVRTWLYVRDIDCNYKKLCDARKKYFGKIGITKDTHFIASTGIEGATEKAARHYVMDSLSIKGLKKEQIKYVQAPTHLCPTFAYKTGQAYGKVGRNVTFERATEITYGDRRHIYISGTASIDKEGKILYKKNVLKQTKRTLENIEALLNSCNATMEDMDYLIVYLRDASDHRGVKNYLEKHLPDNVPYIMVRGKICNPMWQIEAEGFCSILEDNKEFSNYF